MLGRKLKVGEYVLLEKIGTGGFGEVWKAEKRTEFSTSYFALKFFQPEDDSIGFESVKKEIQIWQKLNGLPNIISVIEANRFEDFVYVVSEFADGGSLEKWLRTNGGKANTLEEAVKITQQILCGLEGMHKEGFVHRDLKPANVLIKRGIFYLADFGISRRMKTYSKTNSTAGTYEFMPPEAFDKNPSVSVYTDIWAVGVILQILLTGRSPFPQDEIPSLITAILMSEPEPMPANIPGKLRAIVKKALQKKREERFETASEMREALGSPDNFLTEQIVKAEKSETINNVDFDKIERFEIPATEDWREITAEKERQREAEQSLKIARLQREKEENFRKQEQKCEPEQRRFLQRKINRNVMVGIGGFIGLIFLLIWISLTANNPPNIISNNADSKSARDYYTIAYDCGNKKDYDCAIKNYTKAIELKPDFADAYFNRGAEYKNKGNYDQAIRDYTKVIELEPDSADAYFGRGNAYYEKENYDQAIRDYTRAIELKPDYADAYFNRGISHFDKRDDDQAIKDFTKAIELKPDYAGAYNNRGTAYYNKGNYDQAIADYRKALQIDPNAERAKEYLEKALKKKNNR